MRIKFEDTSKGVDYPTNDWQIRVNDDNWLGYERFSITDVTNGTIRPFLIQPGTPHHTFVLKSSGQIGLGTINPQTDLHLAGGFSDATFLFETDGNGWHMLNKCASGRFNITDDSSFTRVPFKIGAGAQQNLMKIGCGATNEVFISGNLIVAGTITPDYVFEDRYPLKSIEEHADFMWKEKHLPAVEKAKVDEGGKGVINLGQRSQELLEELETAHIYIQQLNQEIKALKSLNSTMKENFDNKIKAIENRLSKIDS